MRRFASSYYLLPSILCVALIWLTAPQLFSQTKQEVYDKINAERKKIGFPEISVCKRLEKSAQSWSFFMRYSMKHNTRFLKRFHRTGSECLAIGADPFSSWMKSKSHKQCIMSKGVTVMGLGYWRGKWVLRTFTN